MPFQPSVFRPRLRRTLGTLAIVCLPACTTRNAAPSPASVSLGGWQSETFPLPPGFAPELPTGAESLRFAPGWRDPASENFWSYAFVMWIDEPVPDAARIDELLEHYYSGLMTAYAAGAGHDTTSTPARVDVVRASPNHYEARMRLIDAFATFEPIELRILIDTAAEADAETTAGIRPRCTLRIRLSPQPPQHAIWRSLQAAIGSILSRPPSSEAGGAEEGATSASARPGV